MAMRLPAQLVDDLVRDIFLRLPAGEPRDLVRAAAGCRSWRGMISHPTFARDYRALHRAPPMLGFFLCTNIFTEDGYCREECWVPHVVPAATFCFPACEGRLVLDSRHGLVLFYTPDMDAEFAVCDLVTGDQWEIHADPEHKDIIWDEEEDEFKYNRLNCKAVVLCSRDPCDHLDRHGGSFRVALVASCVSEENVEQAVATVYSSETGEWSERISLNIPFEENSIDANGHSAVVGNKVYVPIVESNCVVEYNMGAQEISLIYPPFVGDEQPCIELMGVKDGLLLFASVVNSSLYLWSMEAGPSGTAGWARRRVIELRGLLPRVIFSSSGRMTRMRAVGFAEGINVIFLGTEDGVYTIELNSDEVLGTEDEVYTIKLNQDQVKKVHETRFRIVIPYMSFYTGDRGTVDSLACVYTLVFGCWKLKHYPTQW